MPPQPERLLEETWDDGLRYTEERGETKLSFHGAAAHCGAESTPNR